MSPRPRPVQPGKLERTATAPSQRTRHADAPRAVSYAVLQAVTEDDAYANLVLPGLLSRRRLSGRDAGFATELTYGTLRGQGYYDAVIARCTDRALADIQPPLLNALRLGAHQLLAMRVGAHAAVDSTVGLVRSELGIGPSKFANAVLRRISEVPAEDWPAKATEGMSEAAAFAARSSHPEWIIRAFRQALLAHGRPAEELEALLAADNVPATPALTALPGLTAVQDLLDEGAEPGRWSPVAALAAGREPASFPSVRSGLVRVQDEGSQLVAQALLVPEIDEARNTGRWLDLCSGPGGKSALLAAIGDQRGATLTAVELSEHRSKLVVQALQPHRGDHEILTGDGRDFGTEFPDQYDRVLIDVPCTGLGALRRRPEARWRRLPADIPALAPVQRELLKSGIRAVRPGGVVAYTTCSPHAAETIAVIEDVMKSTPGLEVLDAPQALDTVAGTNIGAGSGRFAQLWPHLHGTDGMFLALLRKTGA
ncbi:transcription antitermination factor NusB [Saxibacter everestensis]|uniref:Transcription antitermination factor NusB n=1 Tax=Saxibacter everestensis TaxID=2909229 RepID=A0ABY8QZB7_9MICO|nr:transcription antitermination factor NusB [Brevibacteriaceae bacterium ZFBP1038]